MDFPFKMSKASGIFRNQFFYSFQGGAYAYCIMGCPPKKIPLSHKNVVLVKKRTP